MLTLEAGEEIVIEVRKHWLQLTIESLGLGVAAVVPPILAIVFMEARGLFADPAVIALACFAFAIWLLLLWMIFFIGWTTYFLDTWIVTNKRLIDFDQRALFVRSTAILHLENVQDVEIEVKGILHTLFNLGRIRVQTAGTNPEFSIHFARRPAEAKAKILELAAARRAASGKEGV